MYAVFLMVQLLSVLFIYVFAFITIFEKQSKTYFKWGIPHQVFAKLLKYLSCIQSFKKHNLKTTDNGQDLKLYS